MCMEDCWSGAKREKKKRGQSQFCHEDTTFFARNRNRMFITMEKTLQNHHFQHVSVIYLGKKSLADLTRKACPPDEKSMPKSGLSASVDSDASLGAASRCPAGLSRHGLDGCSRPDLVEFWKDSCAVQTPQVLAAVSAQFEEGLRFRASGGPRAVSSFSPTEVFISLQLRCQRLRRCLTLNMTVGGGSSTSCLTASSNRQREQPKKKRPHGVESRFHLIGSGLLLLLRRRTTQVPLNWRILRWISRTYDVRHERFK